MSAAPAVVRFRGEPFAVDPDATSLDLSDPRRTPAGAGPIDLAGLDAPPRCTRLRWRGPTAAWAPCWPPATGSTT